jgi:hypothetical protein
MHTCLIHRMCGSTIFEGKLSIDVATSESSLYDDQ